MTFRQAAAVESRPGCHVSFWPASAPAASICFLHPVLTKQGHFKIPSLSHNQLHLHLHTGYWAEGEAEAHARLLDLPPTHHLQRWETGCRRHQRGALLEWTDTGEVRERGGGRKEGCGGRNKKRETEEEWWSRQRWQEVRNGAELVLILQQSPPQPPTASVCGFVQITQHLRDRVSVCVQVAGVENSWSVIWISWRHKNERINLARFFLQNYESVSMLMPFLRLVFEGDILCWIDLAGVLIRTYLCL